MSDVTVLMTTSVIPSHPSTDIIEQALILTRIVLPDSPIIIMADGIRPEQADRTHDYAEYLARLLALTADMPNVAVQIHPEFAHQTGMLAWALASVDTPYIMFTEHDLPPVGSIPVDAICGAIGSGDVNVMRLNINTELEVHHRHMRMEETALDVGGVPAVRTWQWSSITQFASTDYYRWIHRQFLDGQRTYIEWIMSGVVVQAWKERGWAGWEDHRIWIYHPDGDTRRCLHLDGRKDGPVFDDDGRDVTVRA